MNYFEYRHIIVIGSGIGVTPLMSIWKYLVNRASSMYYRIQAASLRRVTRRMSTSNLGQSIQGSISIMKNADDASSAVAFGSTEFGDDPLEEATVEECSEELYQEEVEKKKPKTERIGSFVEKIFESMTVSMIVLCIFVMGETFGIVFQMFGLVVFANVLSTFFSLFALMFHGLNAVASLFARGIRLCLGLFKFWLELMIVALDFAALYLSIQGFVRKDIEREATTIALYFFFAVVTLHALRIFHLFYIALKPPKVQSDVTSESSVTNRNASMGSTDVQSLGTLSKGDDGPDNSEICSIQGILINRYYSGMRFAAKSLMPPTEYGLSKLFSMEFYGTREKPKDESHDEKALIRSMAENHRQSKTNLLIEQNPDDYFHAGRPDWKQIFTKAIAKAHKTCPSRRKNGTVGVFFCGSPAIAHDLQCMAKEVTAQHQYSRKHLDGTACRCKLIVHSENF
jgi:hypothetical protein